MQIKLQNVALGVRLFFAKPYQADKCDVNCAWAWVQ